MCAAPVSASFAASSSRADQSALSGVPGTPATPLRSACRSWLHLSEFRSEPGPLLMSPRAPEEVVLIRRLRSSEHLFHLPRGLVRFGFGLLALLPGFPVLFKQVAPVEVILALHFQAFCPLPGGVQAPEVIRRDLLAQGGCQSLGFFAGSTPGARAISSLPRYARRAPGAGPEQLAPRQVGSGRARLELGRAGVRGIGRAPPMPPGLSPWRLAPGALPLPGVPALRRRASAGLARSGAASPALLPDHRCLRLFALSDELLAPRFDHRFRDLFWQLGRGRRFSEPV